jgi:hypothetical protein
LLREQFKELVHEKECFFLFDQGKFFLVDQGHQPNFFDQLVKDTHVGGYLVGGQRFTSQPFEGLFLFLRVDDVVVDAVNQSDRISEVLPIRHKPEECVLKLIVLFVDVLDPSQDGHFCSGVNVRLNLIVAGI